MPAETVERLREGDVAAFDEIYSAYRPRLFGFLVRMSRQRSLAEDLVQETFLRLARAAPRLEPDSNIGAWLFRVARNLLVSHRRRRLPTVDSLLEAAHWVHGTSAPMPDASVDAQSEFARLEGALQRLRSADREVLLLIGVEQLSHEEAAAILGIRDAALRKRLSRARQRLRNELDDGVVVVPGRKNVWNAT